MVSTSWTSSTTRSILPPARRNCVDLLKTFTDIGRSRGWTVIRWITAEDNARARKVYDRLATKTAWVTYDIKL